MPASTLPNLGLKAFYSPGENGWGEDMSINLLKLSVLVQGGVANKYPAEPGAPADGMVIILDETAGANANKVGIRQAGAWIYVTPSEGWMLYNRAANVFEFFNGVTWTVLDLSPPDTVPVAPPSLVKPVAANYTVDADDAGSYIRLTQATAKNVIIQTDVTEPLPANAEWHIRNAGAGNATIAPVAGVTVNAPAGGSLAIPLGGTVTLKRVAVDTFDVLGQTVPA